MRVKFVLLAVVVVVLAYAARFDVIDDAYIYARCIANALAGKGLVFNPGEHVNALSSPLFAYLLLGVAWLLKGNVLLAATVLSALGLFGACALAESMVPYAGFLVASTAFFYSLVGMESSVFLFMLLLMVHLYQTNRLVLLPTAAVLLILTRFEGGLMVAAIVYCLLRTRRWPKLLSFVPALGLGLIYLTLNHHWYGSYLPSSAGAKIGQGMSGYWGRWPFAFVSGLYQLKHDFVPMLYVIPLVLIFGYMGWRKMRATDYNTIVPIFCILLLSFYVFCNIPGYRWYDAPFIFFAMIYAARGLPESRFTLPAFTAIAVLMIGTSLHEFPPRPHGEPSYITFGLWLKTHTPPGARISADETGTLGYYCNCYIIDILGLTTPKNAAHIAHRDPSSWLKEDNPDYIVVHDDKWIFEQVAKDSPDYQTTPVRFRNAYLLQRKLH